jgi:hypothetical protein
MKCEREAEAQTVRRQLKLDVARCEFCGRRNHGLQVHEILRGSGLRLKTLDELCSVLVLCNACHDLMGGRHPSEQLAILKRSRDHDFCLARYYDLAGRKYPDERDIDLWSLRYAFVPNL